MQKVGENWELKKIKSTVAVTLQALKISHY